MSQQTALVDAKEHVVDALYLSVHQGACLLGVWSLPWGSRWIRPHFMRVFTKELTHSVSHPPYAEIMTKVKKLSSLLNTNSKKKKAVSFISLRQVLRTVAVHKYVSGNEWYDRKILNQNPTNAMVKWLLSTMTLEAHSVFNKLNFKKTK